MSDLIRAHEGNPNVSPDDPAKIHWGKFNMFGRFIQTTTHCQIQCQTTSDYCLPERERILKVVFNEYVMSEDVRFNSKLLSSFTEHYADANIASCTYPRLGPS